MDNEEIKNRPPESRPGDQERAGWKVDLDFYRGPLDLLLYLINQEEVDIYDIPISHITEQYLRYIDVILACDSGGRMINLNLVGEFLLMASTLMEIKSKMLLPREVVDLDEIEDPRLELVRQLLEYKRFKDAAGELGARAALRELKFARPYDSIAAPDIGEQELTDDENLYADLPEDVTIWDLVNIFAKILQDTRVETTHTIPQDRRSLRQYRIDLLELLRRRRRIRFTAIFEDLSDRTAIIGMFLALLELIRNRRAKCHQAEEFGEILIGIGERGHIDIPEDLRETIVRSTPQPRDEPEPDTAVAGNGIPISPFPLSIPSAADETAPTAEEPQRSDGPDGDEQPPVLNASGPGGNSADVESLPAGRQPEPPPPQPGG